MVQDPTQPTATCRADKTKIYVAQFNFAAAAIVSEFSVLQGFKF